MITQEYLKSILNYNPETGLFYWGVSKGTRVKKGMLAGAVDGSGYRQIQINKKTYKEHLLAWLYVYNEFPVNKIDHINHNRQDNRIINLRKVSKKENLKNKSLYKNNKTGFIGIKFYKKLNKYKAQITIDRKQIHLGYFTTLQDAIEARKIANNQYEFHKNHGGN